MNEQARAQGRHVPPWVIYLACWLVVGLYQGLNASIGEGSEVASWKPFVWEISSVLINSVRGETGELRLPPG